MSDASGSTPVAIACSELDVYHRNTFAISYPVTNAVRSLSEVIKVDVDAGTVRDMINQHV